MRCSLPSGNKAERKEALNRLLAGQEAPAEQPRPTSLDDGVRRPAPIQGDPNAELSALIYGLARGDLSGYEWDRRRSHRAD
jgi:hypothetical protein